MFQVSDSLHIIFFVYKLIFELRVLYKKSYACEYCIKEVFYLLLLNNVMENVML